MSSNGCIIPECYIDSCLIEVLLHADRDFVNHQKGNGTVAREMKGKFKGNFCVGIIDGDRKELDYLKEFETIIETNDLKLWKHKAERHYIIQVRPVIERWVLTLCEKAGIKLSVYGLPDELLGLKRITKSVASKKDERFKRLFKDMLRMEIGPVIQLRDWLEYLKKNKFNADINKLKNG